MPEKQFYDKSSQYLHVTSSITKIWNQLVMFIVLGIFPLVFPQWIFLEHQKIIFINLVIALLSSSFFEISLLYLRKKKKDVSLVIKLQLFTSVVLLTWFLHYFGRINGPFFPLYLITIMEAFLHRYLNLSNLLVLIMVLATSFEFFWLLKTKEIILDFFNILAFVFRLVSLIFIRIYGLVLAQKINSEALAKKRAKSDARKLAEFSLKLKKANLELKKLSALKDEFIFLTSHELRTPLTSIGSALTTILEGYTGSNLNPEIKDFLESAYNENQRLLRLVNNLLNISRIETGKIEYSLKEFILDELILEVITNIKPLFKEKKVKFYYYIEPQIKVKADKDKVREILINLLINALKFTAEGYISLTVWKQGKTALVAIEDSGRGIDKKRQNELFKKYSKLEKEKEEENKGGVGLGLYLCKTFLKAMKEEIWFVSQKNKGSCFYFTLSLV